MRISIPGNVWLVDGARTYLVKKHFYMKNKDENLNFVYLRPLLYIFTLDLQTGAEGYVDNSIINVTNSSGKNVCAMH